MQLLVQREATPIERWSGTQMRAYLTQLVSDLEDAYTFSDVQDTLEITSGDGTSSIAWSGNIKLYIDDATWIEFDLYRRSSSYRLEMLTYLYTINNSYQINGSDIYGAQGTEYYGHAIWETESGHIVISLCENIENMNNCTPLSSGLCFIIGTSTNQYNNISIPTIIGVMGGISKLGGQKFLGTNDYLNRLTFANTKCRQINMMQLLLNTSDIAVLCPICSPYNHYLMDNILVSSLIPTCFSDTYSTITYRGHQYAQFGRYLLLDESEV